MKLGSVSLLTLLLFSVTLLLACVPPPQTKTETPAEGSPPEAEFELEVEPETTKVNPNSDADPKFDPYELSEAELIEVIHRSLSAAVSAAQKLAEALAGAVGDDRITPEEIISLEPLIENAEDALFKAEDAIYAYLDLYAEEDTPRYTVLSDIELDLSDIWFFIDGIYYFVEAGAVDATELIPDIRETLSEFNQVISSLRARKFR